MSKPGVARVAFRAPQRSVRGRPPVVPAGTHLPATAFRPAGPPGAGGYASRVSCRAQSNSVPLFQSACRSTASLRATATLARFSPTRSASRVPHAFSADGRGTRFSSTPAASNR